MAGTAVMALPEHGVNEPPPIAEYRPTCLVLVPGLSFGEWVGEWRKLAQMGKSFNWIAGDALIYGEDNFPDQWSQEVDAKFMHQHNGPMWVSRRIPPAERRDPDAVSWSAHREVAGLEPKERKAVLDLAEKEGWGSREVALEVRRRHPEKAKPRVIHSTVQPIPPWNEVEDVVEVVSTTTTETVSALKMVEVPREPVLTPDEALDLLTTLPHGALPEYIAEAISLLVAERVALLRVLVAAEQCVQLFDLPTLAEAVAAARSDG